MAELVARTGVPAATIHHYLRSGMLPPPRRAVATRFLYDERHVQAVRLARTLRARRKLPLAVIRRILPDLLGMEEDQAFRPEMWDRAVDLRARHGGRRGTPGRLLDAALESFSRRGFDDVNVDDLCRAARIAKGSFYRHHRSKEDVFLAAAGAAAEEAAAAFGRAMSPGPVQPERAAEVLARSLERRLPIFLDLFSRAAQGRPGHPAAAGRACRDLSLAVGRCLRGPNPEGTGERVVRLALGLALARVATLAVPQPSAGRMAGPV